MKTKKTKRVHAPEFKEKAVQLALSEGNVASVARQLDVAYNLLRGWITAAEAAKSKGQGLQQAMEDEAKMKQLQKDNARLREEVEILKKATAYFATEQLSKSSPRSKN